MKRILSLALALVMVLSAVPATVFATEATPTLPTAKVSEITKDDLTFAMNFRVNSVTEEQLTYYGNWYADFELTVNKEVTFNNDGSADGWLAGQYDEWSYDWVTVPFGKFAPVTLEANETMKIMAFAAECLDEPGLKYTFREVYETVKDFNCGVFFDDEFLLANPDLVVTLELKMYNPENESENYVIGETYTYYNPIVAMNTATNKAYSTVMDAMLDCAEDQTVALLKDVNEAMVSVFGDTTLDLNGHALNAGYVSCFGDIIDSSADNSGLLVVPASRFMIREDNAQMPVHNGNGYRFVEVLRIDTVYLEAESKFCFQPRIEPSMLALLKQGSAVTGITIQVEVSWKQGNGYRTQNFVYNDSYVQQYLNSYKPATDKYSQMFTLTLNGAESFEELTFTATVVSDTKVSFSSDPLQNQKPAGNVTTDANNQVVNDVNIGDSNASALVPSGTQLESGANNVTLSATEMERTTSNITLDDGEQMVSMNVHVAGVSANNTKPIIVTLNKLAPEALNQGNLKLYHVENGETVEMTRVYDLAEVDAHNEYYYDIATGDVTMALATFSEVAVVSDTENHWNGAIDTRWVDSTKTEFEIFNADQLAGLRYVVDNNGITFKGTTITLMADIDLYGVDENGNRLNFEPIGFGYEFNGGQVFKGTFDGNGHTIANLYQNGWDLGAETYTYSMAGGGLFASIVDANIKNLTMDGASIVMECIDMGVVVGYANGNCTFENIVVKNSTIQNYNRATGGVIGEVGGGGTYILNNVDVESTTTVSALWGTFDPSCGGIIGAKWGEAGTRAGKGTEVTVTMTDCDVAAKMDVYNDVTSAYQWYSYRRCGMLIGYTEESRTINGRTEATASFLTTENCTVQYGDWADYHYCEFTDTTSLDARYPWVRVEAGLSNGAYSNARYGVPTFANGTLDTSAAHITNKDCHNETDGHHILIRFNQLYGGGQGCYGGNQHIEDNKGVTVIGAIEPAKKFTAKENLLFVTNTNNTVTVKLSELFEAIPDADIHNAGVHVYVSPANEFGTARGSFVPSASADWEDMPLTITGSGKAIVTISDYYYCISTSVEIDIINSEAAILSSTNPDMYFTGDEDIDLVLYIRKIDGVTEPLNGVLTITGPNGFKRQIEGRVAAFENYKRSIGSLLDLSELPDSGIFTVQVVLTDKAGEERINLEQTFYRVKKNSVTAEITSETNPDLVFTQDEKIDLNLIVRKTDGIAESFTAAVTIYDSEGNPLGSKEGTLAKKTSLEVAVSELLDLSSLTPGTFTIEVVLTDSSKNERLTLSETFYRVGKDSVEAEITSDTNRDLVFTKGDNIDLDLTVRKNDGIAESFTAAVTILDREGNPLVSKEGTLAKNTSLKVAVSELLDLSSLTETGTYTIQVVLSDSSEDERLTLTTNFYIVALNSVEAEIFSPSGADVYFTEGEGYDRVLHVVKTDGIAESLIVTATIYSDAGEALLTGTATLERSADLTKPISKLLDLSQLPDSGIFKLQVILTDNTGNQRAKVSETFARVTGASVIAEITSATNPDLVFTKGENIDLALKLHKNDGIAESFNGVMTIYDSNDEPIVSYEGAFRQTTNAAVMIAELLDLTKLPETGIFKIRVVLKDSSNIERVNLTKNFAIVALTSATVQIGSATSSDLVFTQGEAFDLQLQMTKGDTVPEDFTATVTVTDSEGTVISGSGTIEKGTNTKEYISNLLDMSGLTAPGTYTIRVDLKDNAGYARATLIKTFYLVEKEGSVTTQIGSSINPDLIFTDKDALDLKFSVEKTDGIAEQLHAYYTVLDGDLNAVQSGDAKISVLASGKRYYDIKLDALDHGTYTVVLEIKDSSDSDCIRSTSTLTFTRISGDSSDIFCAIRTASGSNSLVYNLNEAVAFTVGAQKQDDVSETFTVKLELKNPSGKTIYQKDTKAVVPSSDYFRWNLNIGRAPSAGTYKIIVTLFDDVKLDDGTENVRATYEFDLVITE